MALNSRVPATQELEAQLEAIVDQVGLSVILNALGQVCGDKEEHIRTNWQDRGLADAWKRAGNKIIRLSFDDTINSL